MANCGCSGGFSRCNGCGVTSLDYVSCCWSNRPVITASSNCDDPCCITGCCDTGTMANPPEYSVDYLVEHKKKTKHKECTNGTGFHTTLPEYYPPSCGYAIEIEDENYYSWSAKLYPPTCTHTNVWLTDTEELNGYWYIVDSQTSGPRYQNIYRGPQGCGGIICGSYFSYFSGIGSILSKQICDASYDTWGIPVCPTCV